MADKRAYFKLDVGYLTNPKLVLVGMESPTAVILHVGSIAYAAQHLTDGEVPVALLLRLTGATKKDAELLLAHGLWHDLGDGKAEVHDFLEHQRSAADVKGASEAGKRGAKARWDAERNADGNATGNADRMPDALGSASESAMPREIGEREKRDITAGPTRSARSTTAKRTFPTDFEPSEGNRRIAAERGVDLRAAFENFRDHHMAKGSTFKDWNLAFNTWLRKERPDPRLTQPAPYRPRPHELVKPPDGLTDAQYDEFLKDPQGFVDRWSA